MEIRNPMSWRERLDTGMSAVLIGLMSVMAVNVLWQVFSRYILDAPSSFTEELARYLMIWLGLLGAAYVSGQGGHVAIDVVRRRFSEKGRRRMARIASWAVLLFCLFAMVLGGGRLVYITLVLEQYSPALGLPLALVYAVVPISGLITALYTWDDLRNT